MLITRGTRKFVDFVGIDLRESKSVVFKLACALELWQIVSPPLGPIFRSSDLSGLWSQYLNLKVCSMTLLWIRGCGHRKGKESWRRSKETAPFLSLFFVLNSYYTTPIQIIKTWTITVSYQCQGGICYFSSGTCPSHNTKMKRDFMFKYVFMII